MKLCNEFLKTLTWFVFILAMSGVIANQVKLAFRLVDDNTTLTGWTVLEDRADYDWCHAWIGSDTEVIADGMVKTKEFGNVYIYKRRK